MRERLQELEGQRIRIQGHFTRYGIRPNYQIFQRTLCLQGVRDTETGLILADHMWFRCGLNFDSLGELENGAQIELDGTVEQYSRTAYRGSRGRKGSGELIDYRISRPGKIVVVRR
ncbi:MAG: hypothetical protein ACK50J_10360 [Planctomyces sp.]